MLVLVLSLAIYATMCVAIARLFARTGHSGLWQALAWAPLMLVLAAYALDAAGIDGLSRGILSAVVLCYLAILLTLAFKAWPIDRAVRAEVFR